MKKNEKRLKRVRRHVHIRKTLSGDSVKPRLFVYKSNRYFYVGVADDERGVVLGSVSVPKRGTYGEAVLKDLVKLLKSLKVQTAVFDRSGYRFHGNIQKMVDGLRKEGFKI